MIFIVIHMVIAALLHVVFSEDLAFLKQGHYLKFFHNVIMNAFASIYFHNYLRLDEMPSSHHKFEETKIRLHSLRRDLCLIPAALIRLATFLAVKPNVKKI